MFSGAVKGGRWYEIGLGNLVSQAFKNYFYFMILSITIIRCMNQQQH